MRRSFERNTVFWYAKLHKKYQVCAILGKYFEKSSFFMGVLYSLLKENS